MQNLENQPISPIISRKTVLEESVKTLNEDFFVAYKQAINATNDLDRIRFQRQANEVYRQLCIQNDELQQILTTLNREQPTTQQRTNTSQQSNKKKADLTILGGLLIAIIFLIIGWGFYSINHYPFSNIFTQITTLDFEQNEDIDIIKSLTQTKSINIVELESDNNKSLKIDLDAANNQIAGGIEISLSGFGSVEAVSADFLLPQTSNKVNVYWVAELENGTQIKSIHIGLNQGYWTPFIWLIKTPDSSRIKNLRVGIFGQDSAYTGAVFIDNLTFYSLKQRTPIK